MGKIEAKELVLKDGRKGIIRTAEEADAEKNLKQIESAGWQRLSADRRWRLLIICYWGFVIDSSF